METSDNTLDYQVTPEGNQAVSRILSNGKKQTIVYRRNYTTIDFLKPSRLELRGMARAAILFSPFIAYAEYKTGGSLIAAAASSLIPQAAIYAAARLYERYGNGWFRDRIRHTKVPTPYREIRRNLEDVVNLSETNPVRNEINPVRAENELQDKFKKLPVIVDQAEKVYNKPIFTVYTNKKKKRKV